MRAAVVLAAACAGCLDVPPLAADEVITRFAPAAGAHPADGVTPIEVTVCTVDVAGRDRTASATLRSAVGRWDLGDADPTVITVPMSAACEARLLRPGTAAGTFALTAQLAGATVPASVALTAAPIARVRLARSGALDPTAGGTLTITATLDPAASGGKPTAGTEVELAAHVDAAGAGSASAAVAEPVLVIGATASVTTTVLVSAGVTALTVTATARVAGQPEVKAALAIGP